jgi:hypothetical protein
VISRNNSGRRLGTIQIIRRSASSPSRFGTACNYTRQRPKIVEKSGDDIELKARSQPTRTRFSARMSDGRDLGPCLVGADVLLSRSPLSVRSTNMGLEIIPSVLGNDGREIRTIEQSAVPTIASRVMVLRISPSHH